jgi:hypothetical protein
VQPPNDGKLCFLRHASFQADFKAATMALIFFLPRSSGLGSASAASSAAASSALTFATRALALGARCVTPIIVPDANSDGQEPPGPGGVTHQGRGQLRVRGGPPVVEQIPLLVAGETAGMHRHLGDVLGHVDDAAAIRIREALGLPAAASAGGSGRR